MKKIKFDHIYAGLGSQILKGLWQGPFVGSFWRLAIRVFLLKRTRLHPRVDSFTLSGQVSFGFNFLYGNGAISQKLAWIRLLKYLYCIYENDKVKSYVGPTCVERPRTNFHKASVAHTGKLLSHLPKFCAVTSFLKFYPCQIGVPVLSTLHGKFRKIMPSNWSVKQYCNHTLKVFYVDTVH